MVNDIFAPALAGRRSDRGDHGASIMDGWSSENSYAKCAVDIALHDLWGKSVGQPIYRLLAARCATQCRSPT